VLPELFITLQLLFSLLTCFENAIDAEAAEKYGLS